MRTFRSKFSSTTKTLTYFLHNELYIKTNNNTVPATKNAPPHQVNIFTNCLSSGLKSPIIPSTHYHSITLKTACQVNYFTKICIFYLTNRENLCIILTESKAKNNIYSPYTSNSAIYIVLFLCLFALYLSKLSNFCIYYMCDICK